MKSLLNQFKQLSSRVWKRQLVPNFINVLKRRNRWKKTAAFCSIIVVLSTIAGMIYGWIIA